MNSEILPLIQSFIYSAIILLPIMMILKGLIVKYGPESIKLENLSDNVVRALALFVFALIVTSVVIIIFNWQNWYGLLGPVETILLFIFIPLYRKME